MHGFKHHSPHSPFFSSHCTPLDSLNSQQYITGLAQLHSISNIGQSGSGGKRAPRQREERKSKRLRLRVGTLNVGTMTGKARELVDMMQRRKVDILWVIR